MEHIGKNGEDRPTLDPQIAKTEALYSMLEELKYFSPEELTLKIQFLQTHRHGEQIGGCHMEAGLGGWVKR